MNGLRFFKSKSNNFISNSNPNPKTDSLEIHILFKSKILPLCLGYMQTNSNIQRQKNSLKTNSTETYAGLLAHNIIRIDTSKTSS